MEITALSGSDFDGIQQPNAEVPELATECRQFFEIAQTAQERCKKIQALDEHTQLLWEQQVASAYSPGVVQDEEEVCRYWINPHHWDEATGRLKPTAFDDVSTIGFSINRLEYVSVPEIYEMAQSRVTAWNADNAAKPQRSVVGFSLFNAVEVRREMADVRRAFGVFDTATPPKPAENIVEDVSHAEVYQLVKSDQLVRSLRSKMRDLLAPRLQQF